MKKFFFFRSSTQSNSNNLPETLQSKDKKGYIRNNSFVNHEANKYENSYQSPRRSFSKSKHQASDSTNSSNHSGSVLRRSRSLTSAALLGESFKHGSLSPLKILNGSPVHETYGPYFSSRKSVPVKQLKSKQSENGAFRGRHEPRKSVSVDSPKPNFDSSGHASYSSSYVSSKVVDRYIDGEQHQDTRRHKTSRPKIPACKGSGFLSSRALYTAPSSPTDYCKSKSKSPSFREAKGSFLNFNSGGWTGSGFGHESPRTLAKNVIERLTQTSTFPKASSDDLDREIPIMVRDVYCGSSDKCFDPNSNVGTPKSISFSEPHEAIKSLHQKDINGYHEKGSLDTRKYENFISSQIKNDLDLELWARHSEAKARVALFSEELQDDRFLLDFSCDIPTLMQTIRNLHEVRISLAAEVVDLLRLTITDRLSVKEELRLAKAELQSQTRRHEKEKKELQLILEKEIERRSTDWLCKLEKIQLEEQRLRERVRELAEQNVLIQREVCSINERELESRTFVSCSEQHAGEMKARVEQVSQKNRDLQQSLSDVREKFQASEETVELTKRNFLEKERECKELHKSIAGLSRTCSDQQKTIEGLRRVLHESGGIQQNPRTVDDQVSELRTELVRLTGVEFSLRKELEVNRRERESLRQENIILLGRLKGNCKDVGASFFLVNEEMNSRVGCLQNDALFMLNDAADLCTKVLEFIKSRAGKLEATDEGVGAIQSKLDGQFIVEADMKLQGMKQKAENLAMSFQTMCKLLQEKAKVFSSKSRQQDIRPDDGSPQLSSWTSEDALESELQAESLMTRLLREKLYSKEMEVEQLQADLATVVRAADCVRSEVHNALNRLSSVTHRLKELELQMRKKDEGIGQLETQVDESMRELSSMKELLPKVSQERDQMWQDNMVLSSEVGVLRKKINDLEEVVHKKEGQISILRCMSNEISGMI